MPGDTVIPSTGETREISKSDGPIVFLSSSIKGNEDLRSSLVTFFEKHGYVPIHIDSHSAGPHTGKPGIAEMCLNGVRHSDLFFLVLSHRYGSTDQKDDEGNSISLTEREFLVADKLNKRIMVYCRDEVWCVFRVFRKNRWCPN